MGDAERVASHTTISAMVLSADIDDGNDRTIRANFNIVCRTEEQMKH